MISEELKIVVRAEASNAVRELRQLQGTTQKVSLNFKDIAKSLIGPLGVAAGIGMLTGKLIQGVRSSVQYAASMEKMGVAFEVMLGSASKAEKTLEEIRKFSIATPFEFKNLVPAAQRLIAFGTAADDVVDTMRDLGNLSMGNQQSLDRLTLAYGKLQARGRASLEELNMFTEAGVPILKQLQEQLGLTKEELFDYITTGKVGFEDVNKALQNMARGEGQFAGMLERQSQTLEGAISTLTGAVQDLGGALAEDFLPWLTKIVQKATDLVDTISKGMTYAEAYSEIGIGTFGRGIGSDFTNVQGLSQAEIASRQELANLVAMGLGEELQARSEGRIGPTTNLTWYRTDKALEQLKASAQEAALQLGRFLPDDRWNTIGGGSRTGRGTSGGGGTGEELKYSPLFGPGAYTYGSAYARAMGMQLGSLGSPDYFPLGPAWGSTPAGGLGPYSRPEYSPLFTEADRTYGSVYARAMGMQLGSLGSPGYFPLGPAWGATPAGGLGAYSPGPADFSRGGFDIEGARAERIAEAAQALNEAMASGGWTEKLSEAEINIKNIEDTMVSMAKDGAIAELQSVFTSMGQALAGAKSGTEVLEDVLAGITARMSEIFLWGALSWFKTGTKEGAFIGTGFLILAGVSGIASGFFGSGGISGTGAPSSAGYTPSAYQTSSRGGTVYGAGTNIKNPTVVQNVQGSIITTDELGSFAANAARSINSGR